MKSKKIIILLFFVVGFASRFPLSERFMSHTDASSLTLALSHYDLQQETPAPPGYPLYFAIGAFINFFLNNPHLSLVLESAIFSGIGAVIFYLFGNSFGGKRTGLISSVLFLSSPSFYFFGLTVYPYIVVITSYTLFVWKTYDVVVKGKSEWLLLGLSYGLLIGIRPQELITTLPMFIFALYVLSGVNKVKALSVFSLFSALWFVPFLSLVGGLENYIRVSTMAASVAFPSPSLTQFLSKKFELLSGLYLTIPAGLFILPFYLIRNLERKNIKRKDDFKKKLSVFFAFWVLPVLAFNLFIRTEHVGYQAGYLIFLLLMTAYAIVNLFKKKSFLIGTTLFIAILNLFIFFQDRDPSYQKPYRQSSFHYSDLRRNDFELSNKIGYIKKKYDPATTIVIAGPFFWRHARFYLPEYLIYEIDAFTTSETGANTRRDAKNLTYRMYSSKSRYFIVPKNISSLVLFDDEMSTWVKGEREEFVFKGISRLTAVRVKQGDIVRYGFKTLQVIHR